MKTAIILLPTYGNLDGVIVVTVDSESEMKAPMRAKIIAAADYLNVAPAVVGVVRDL